MNNVEHLPPSAARLKPAQNELELAITPLVEGLSDVPSFNGAVLFVADHWHRQSAGAVALVHTPGLSDERLHFTNANINNRRVDITATTVGQTFQTRQSRLSPSRMNPDEHTVWGAYMTPGHNEAAVLQLAFDNSLPLPSEEVLASAWEPYSTIINDATEALIRADLDRTSLANDLLLDTPVTPNAFVIKWDITRSTKMVHHQYPLFRQYLDELERSINALTETYSGRIVAYGGDGQNIVIDIPEGIDRTNLAEIGAFGARTAAPLTRAILEAHAQIASSYAALRPNIRVGLDLGHTELSELGEETGSVFWSAAETIDSLPRNQTGSNTTRMARLALMVARQIK